MDPQAQGVLDRLAALSPAAPADADDATWVANFRCGVALISTFAAPPEPVLRVEQRVIVGPGGALPLRLYRPAEGRLPVLLYLHGGGAVAGAVDIHDSPLRALANRSGWLVAAPDYRLAPDARFPAQVDDAAATLAWIAAEGDAIGADASRVVVAGDSIGGAFAAALALRSRDGGPRLAGQILLYPNTDLRRDVDYPSRRSENGHIIEAAGLERQIELSLASKADRGSPLASPVLSDGAGLAPTLVVTNECDPLRDEGEALAARWAPAGVQVEQHRFPGMIHAFMQMGAHIDAAERLFAMIADWLRRLD